LGTSERAARGARGAEIRVDRTEVIALRVIVLLFTAIVLQVSGTAWARDVAAVMSTGREGGSYYRIGQRLQRTMAAEHEVWIDVLTSRGSLANLARLDDPSSPVGVTLTQADALNRYLQSHPEFADEFIVLGDAGKECVFLIAGSAGSITTAANLKEETGGEISVDDSESGASVTFEYMTQLEPRFGATTASPVDTMEALLQLKMATEHTKLKAAMVVQRPKVLSTPMRVALENPDDYRLVPITEADVGNARLPDGNVVYSFEHVNVGGLQRSAEIDTMCTRGLMLASKEKLSKDLRSQLSTLMLESAAKIIGFDE
jgi:TRAP-type uncharacterized transport system substrate-binding protein